jgi:biopolymer transport protein ExbB
MYPLLLISLFGVAWMVHCLLVLRPSQIVPQKLMDTLGSQLSQGDLRGAASACEASQSVFARVVLAGLRRVGDVPDKIREAVAAAGSREVAHLQQKIVYLAHVGTISPMLGLLGTVTGMVMGFSVIASGEVRHYLLAAAIAQALITTVVGLCIGIPAMVVYYYLRARLLRLTTHMELVADEVTTTIIEKGEEA